MVVSTPFEDARRTLVPPAGDPDGPLPPLLLGLTVVTGLVDAFSYLVLGHVFVANMTGNVVFLGFALAGASGFSVPASLTALGGFGLGAVAGGRLAARVGTRRGRLLAVATTVEAVLFAAAVVVAATAGNPGSGAARYALIVLLAVAMGTQNAVARRLAVADLTTTVLTLTLTGVFADARVAGGPSSRIGRRSLSVLAMFVGALAGALLVVRSSDWLAVAAGLVVLVAVVATTAVLSRRDPPWSRASSPSPPRSPPRG
jgi:uncharacterized membrane protein YoaK (UPF0700 family)